MTVKFHSLLIRIVHTVSGKICDLLDSHHRADGQLMIKPVKGGHTFDLHKGSGFELASDILQELIFHKHFHMDGIRKIGQGHGNDGTLATDLPLFHAEDLAFDSDLSHLLLHLLQRDRLILKVSSIEYIRVIASAVAATRAKRAPPAATAEGTAFLSAASLCSRCALSCCSRCFRLLLFSGSFRLRLCLRFGSLLFPQILA